MIRRFLLSALLLLGAVLIFCYGSQVYGLINSKTLYYICAFLAAFFFGIIELLNIFSIGSRYLIGFKNGAAWYYALVNGVAGVVAAGVVGFDASSEAPVIMGLAYGAFGVLILRSSITSVKTASGDVPIGPVIMLDQIKKLLEERVDVQTSTALYARVAVVMKDVDFNRARQSLVVSCLLMRERMAKSDQDRLREDVDKLGEMEGFFASVQLGMLIARVTSLEVLEKGVELHRDELVWKEGEGLDRLKAMLYNTPDITRASPFPSLPEQKTS
jgi:hypothetical protein